jgi:hypothetical protein
VSREESQAERAAALMEALLQGERAEGENPDERRVLEAVQLLREQVPRLDPARRDALVDEAFAAARVSRAPPPPGQRMLPYYVAGAALAAALALALGRRPAPPAVVLRSTDAVIGRIAPAEAGDARRRIDLLYADRLAVYRRGAP